MVRPANGGNCQTTSHPSEGWGSPQVVVHRKGGDQLHGGAVVGSGGVAVFVAASQPAMASLKRPPVGVPANPVGQGGVVWCGLAEQTRLWL